MIRYTVLCVHMRLNKSLFSQHTRFEHSLGVMHVAGMAGHALAEKGAIDSEKIIILKLAGLLHDIGHGPFSHMFETLGLG